MNAGAVEEVNPSRRRAGTVLYPQLVNEIVRDIITNVCELPDYNSPDDQPNLIQCTTGELEIILRRALGEGA